jgi:predicted metallopeptidase
MFFSPKSLHSPIFTRLLLNWKDVYGLTPRNIINLIRQKFHISKYSRIKALFFGQWRIGSKIRCALTAADAKRLSKTIPNYDAERWHREEADMVN